MKKVFILLIGLAVIFSAVSSFASTTGDSVKYNLRISNRSEVNALFPQMPYYATVQITDKGDCVEFFVDQIQESLLTPCTTGGGHVIINDFAFNCDVSGVTVSNIAGKNASGADVSGTWSLKGPGAFNGFGYFQYILGHSDGINDAVRSLTFDVCKTGADLQIEDFEVLSTGAAEHGNRFFAVTLANFCLGLFEIDGVTPINSAYFAYCPECTTTLIELSSFTAKAGNKKVTLNWETEAELDNAGFIILRAEAEAGPYVAVNADQIPAKGSETKGAKYQYIDQSVENRIEYFYLLEDLDTFGIATLHGPQSATPRFMNLFK
jgi:hypothetical protein